MYPISLMMSEYILGLITDKFPQSPLPDLLWTFRCPCCIPLQLSSPSRPQPQCHILYLSSHAGRTWYGCKVAPDSSCNQARKIAYLSAVLLRYAPPVKVCSHCEFQYKALTFETLKGKKDWFPHAIPCGTCTLSHTEGWVWQINPKNASCLVLSLSLTMTALTEGGYLGL